MLRVCAGRGVSSLARISARSYSSTVDKAVSETKDESLNVVDSIVLLSTSWLFIFWVALNTNTV